MACACVYIVIYGSCQCLSIVTISVINMGYQPMKPPKTLSLSIKGASALGSVKSIGRVVLKTPNMSFFSIELLKPAEKYTQKAREFSGKVREETEHPFERFYDSSQASLIWQLEYHFLGTQVAI